MFAQCCMEQVLSVFFLELLISAFVLVFKIKLVLS